MIHESSEQLIVQREGLEQSLSERQIFCSLTRRLLSAHLGVGVVFGLHRREIGRREGRRNRETRQAFLGPLRCFRGLRDALAKEPGDLLKRA